MEERGWGIWRKELRETTSPGTVTWRWPQEGGSRVHPSIPSIDTDFYLPLHWSPPNGPLEIFWHRLSTTTSPTLDVNNSSICRNFIPVLCYCVYFYHAFSNVSWHTYYTNLLLISCICFLYIGYRNITLIFTLITTICCFRYFWFSCCFECWYEILNNFQLISL